MAMQCPACGSTHIQPHAVIHADGTHHFQASHTAVTSDGRFVQGSSQGAQTSRLAQHCAPPAPPSPMPFVLAYGGGGLLVYGSMSRCSWITNECAFYGPNFANWHWTLGGLAIIGLGWLLMKGWHQQAQAYTATKRQWQNTWFCHACGGNHTRA